ncbi:nitrate- and nitrite sensing domain-containing protein [Micromonospora yasonensis]|uniref:sensor histidine kinase n=1 Tax=Micromonospora yasonensis TaxID=1128667 RepID=UPI002230D323|nr:nitrate- and nitrite sensing domain-containing protein [Micromonospora yasonensis]MCW3844876.1 nitrate- and nitrite sensing domain-containing protein [Micromonospora yasonensis]
MRSRGTSIRSKVTALLLALVALWAFAAWITVRDSVNLLGVQLLNSKVYVPSEPLLRQLQLERRLATAYLSMPEAPQREAFEAERQRTEQLAAAFDRSSRHWQVSLAGNDVLRHRLDESVAKLNALNDLRRQVDERSTDRVSAARGYTEAIESIFQIYDVTGSLDDKQIAAEAAALIQVNRAKELISQEDALVSGLFGSGRMTGPEYAEYVALVGAERFLAEEFQPRLSPDDQERYRRLAEGEAFTRLRSTQDRLIRDGRPLATLPFDERQWRATVDPAVAAVDEVLSAGGDGVVSRATSVAALVVVRLVVATGLGLIAVIGAVFVSITTARTLLRQLERLREAANRLADERLPDVVERLGRGEEVDVARESPPLQVGDDEIGQVGKAFNAVQETAIRTAVEQAELRRSVREVFLSLARRTQALVHRQLTLLDAMERREHDAEELEDLFRVDHLATRMRRNAENLIVLSGSTPGRSWRRNVPMVDVVRGAVAEVEDYTRVDVRPLGPVSLTGRAVGDVIHLLAELIENALSFSPPHTTVEVRGQLVANGFAIEIEDRGLGMSTEELAAANHRIVDRSELNLANAARLGLYVVSRLTERHGVKVQLKESPYGGTTAVVLIPADLVTGDGPDASTSGAFRAGTGSAATGLVALAPGADRAEPADQGATATTTTAPQTGEAVDASVTVPTVLQTPEVADPAEPATEAPALTPSGLPARTRKRSSGTTEPAGATTAAPPVVAAADGEPASDQATAARGESGLPVRVRQASLVPELRAEAPAGDDEPGDDAVRPPEQVRRMMSSYQRGTRRGRTDAARLLGGAHDAGGEPDSGDEQAT